MTQVNPEKSALELEMEKVLDGLHDQATEESTCEHVRRDEVSAYCTKGLAKGAKVRVQRRVQCTPTLLKKRCFAGPKAYEECPFYQGKLAL